MSMWSSWKKGFDQWEQQTAQVTEKWLKSPSVLEPTGAMLSVTMKMKAAADRAAAMWWGSVGLPTKADQERSLHLLNQLQSRIYDLEEQIAELHETKTDP